MRELLFVCKRSDAYTPQRFSIRHGIYTLGRYSFPELVITKEIQLVDTLYFVRNQGVHILLQYLLLCFLLLSAYFLVSFLLTSHLIDEVFIKQ